MRDGFHRSRSRVTAPERAFLSRRLLVGSQSVEKASEGSACFVARLTAVVGGWGVERGFIDGGGEQVGEGGCWVFWGWTPPHPRGRGMGGVGPGPGLGLGGGPCG